MSNPTREQVSEALTTIANLYLINHGVTAADDRRAYRHAKLVAFYGISPVSAATITAGMTDIQIVRMPAPDGRSNLVDVYGMVLLMPVRLSYAEPRDDIREEAPARTVTVLATLRHAVPAVREAVAAFWRPAPPATSGYAARHRSVTA